MSYQHYKNEGLTTEQTADSITYPHHLVDWVCSLEPHELKISDLWFSIVWEKNGIYIKDNVETDDKRVIAVIDMVNRGTLYQHFSSKNDVLLYLHCLVCIGVLNEHEWDVFNYFL